MKSQLNTINATNMLIEIVWKLIDKGTRSFPEFMELMSY